MIGLLLRVRQLLCKHTVTESRFAEYRRGESTCTSCGKHLRSPAVSETDEG